MCLMVSKVSTNIQNADKNDELKGIGTRSQNNNEMGTSVFTNYK